MNLENWPTLFEALEAKKEADILIKQRIGLFLSKPVQHVFLELRCREFQPKDSIWLIINAFNYGYILGKRAERQRRKGTA